MSPVDAGETYYNLMWNTKFDDWIKEVVIGETDKTEIINALQAYSNKFKKDDFNREYAGKFIGQLKNQNKTLEEVLKTIISNETEGSEELTKSILKDAT